MVLIDPPGSNGAAEELAHQAQAGSSVAFSRLVERFERPLFRFLLVYTQSPADAEELAQETLVRAWEKLDRYRGDWKFSTWLFTIARRQAASHFRARVRSAQQPVPGDLQGPAPDPSQAMSDRELRENLWDLARRVLTEEQRSALWLRYAEDLPTAEIATVLGRRESAVRVLLFRAR